MSVMVSQLKKQGVESFRDLDKTNPEIIAAALKRREATIIP